MAPQLSGLSHRLLGRYGMRLIRALVTLLLKFFFKFFTVTVRNLGLVFVLVFVNCKPGMECKVGWREPILMASSPGYRDQIHDVRRFYKVKNLWTKEVPIENLSLLISLRLCACMV